MMGPIIHIKATELKQIKISLSPSSKFKKKKRKHWKAVFLKYLKCLNQKLPQEDGVSKYAFIMKSQ